MEERGDWVIFLSEFNDYFFISFGLSDPSGEPLNPHRYKQGHVYNRKRVDLEGFGGPEITLTKPSSVVSSYYANTLGYNWWVSITVEVSNSRIRDSFDRNEVYVRRSNPQESGGSGDLVTDV